MVIFTYQDVTYYMYESHDKYSDPIQGPVVGGSGGGGGRSGRVREGRGGGEGGGVCCCMLILRKAMSPCRIQETLISLCSFKEMSLLLRTPLQ